MDPQIQINPFKIQTGSPTKLTDEYVYENSGMQNRQHRLEKEQLEDSNQFKNLLQS